MNPYLAIASACEYNSVTALLTQKLKSCGLFYLAKGVASLIALQFLELGWPFPDLITPIPLHFLRHAARGYNQSALISATLARLLNVKYKRVLKQTHFTLQQTLLNIEERKKATLDFSLISENLDLTNQTVLVIDDLVMTGATLKAAGIALQEANPKALYALTFCRCDLEPEHFMYLA